jgi:hypothetical protein
MKKDNFHQFHLTARFKTFKHAAFVVLELTADNFTKDCGFRMASENATYCILCCSGQHPGLLFWRPHVQASFQKFAFLADVFLSTTRLMVG